MSRKLSSVASANNETDNDKELRRAFSLQYLPKVASNSTKSNKLNGIKLKKTNEIQEPLLSSDD